MGRYYLDIEVEIPSTNEEGEEDYRYIEVEVVIDACYGNLGIGSYEFWGFKGNDVQMGWDIDEVDWDKKNYTPEENKLIDEYVEKHMDDLLDKIEHNY